jgi:hypothetical protein
VPLSDQVVKDEEPIASSEVVQSGSTSEHPGKTVIVPIVIAGDGQDRNALRATLAYGRGDCSQVLLRPRCLAVVHDVSQDDHHVGVDAL